MSAEAVEMAKNAVAAAVRGDVNGQYHYATLLQLDALARGARGPEATYYDELVSHSKMDGATWRQILSGVDSSGVATTAVTCFACGRLQSHEVGKVCAECDYNNVFNATAEAQTR